MQMNLDRKFSVAPMMDWTDRHCRMFHRALTKRALLYTEMVTADAVIHGDRARLIGFDPDEHPLAIQLGGSEPVKLADAARIAEDFGYAEVNLNCGCPSDRVQSGAFGACLMRAPERVAACVLAMQEAVSIPVTVKCRIGVDDDVPEETLFEFIKIVAEAGCETFIVHARKAWLKGLSPKENREIPPLDYELVAALKAHRPDLRIVLNGGIQTLEACQTLLKTFDGVMLGRAAYQTPRLLADVDTLWGEPSMDILTAIENYKPYILERLREGVRLHAMTRHMLGLFQGQPGARAWRRTLSEKAPLDGVGLDVLDEALSKVVHGVAA